MPSLTDWLVSINETKVDIFPLEGATDYKPFIITKCVSMHPDTIAEAYEMTKRPSMPDDMHYAYLLGKVQRKRRFAKFPKALVPENCDLIMEHYQCNLDRAIEILSLITDDDIEKIKKSRFMGGVAR